MRHYFVALMEQHRRHHERHCHGRGERGGPRGPRGGGRHDAHFGRGRRDGGGLFRGRRFSSDDLQLLLLIRLKDGQSHGYQLIKALSDLSGGVYSPSPGMVYPALTYLEEIGFADVTLVGNKKLYSLSDAGRLHLEASASRVADLLEMLGYMAKRAEAMREQESEEDADEDSPMMQARRVLREALRGTREGSEVNRNRVAEILKRAADEIRALSKDAK